MATTTKSKIIAYESEIKNNNNNLIRIVLSEKIDEKILSDILIKLGLKREISALYDEKLFGFRNYSSSIIIDDKNSSIYMVARGPSFELGVAETTYSSYPSIASDIFSSNDNFFMDMAELLINEKAIDKDEILTGYRIFREKHKMKEPDINNIIKEISVYFREPYLEGYVKWIDNSKELILVKHFIKLIMDKYNHVKLIVDKYKEELVSNNSENNKEKVLDIEKLQSDILDKIKECEEKVESVKNLIKDFDYSSKSDYEKSCSKIEEDLAECSENLNDANILNKINKIIDEINQVYKNVYYKKNDISSLASYIGDEENIDLIERL